MRDDNPACCGVTHGCIFAKALMARAAVCECAARLQSGEAAVLDCRSPVAHHNCETLAALFAERARFALKLPAGGRPLLHAQALRLQCGGVSALEAHLRAADAGDDVAPAAPRATADIHRLVAAAQERHGSLAELPWSEIVPRMQAWTPRRRSAR